MSIRFALIMSVIAAAARALSFNGGSTGVDGALVPFTPKPIVLDAQSFSPPLNPAADNVYHFTSIYIAQGVTVKLSSKILSGPVFWPAHGPVEIEGTMDLNGAASEDRRPTLAGAGGYPGGSRHRGYRPEGFTSNVFLVPLVGSGGTGGGNGGTGGGAGGGALLIASSTSIALNGTITANGGASADGTGGNGGAIRLVAPVINGSGILSATSGQPRGTDGFVRFEAFNNLFTGGLTTPLEGTFQLSRPTASVTVPGGSSRFQVNTVLRQPNSRQSR